MTLYGDNQGAITLTHEHQYHMHMKHIDICFHFICWIITKGKLKLVYCPTEDMIADTLTKALPSTKVKHFTYSLDYARIEGECWSRQSKVSHSYIDLVIYRTLSSL